MKAICGLAAVVALLLVPVAWAGPEKPAKKRAQPVAISGYGVTLELRAPFQINRLGRAHKVADALILAHQGRTLKNAMITPSASGPARVDLGADVSDFSELGVQRRGSSEHSWKIETASYRVQWPAEFKLVSTSFGSEWPFELLGRDDTLILIRGPWASEQVPAPEQLVGPGQQLSARGATGESLWIEVSYEHEGKPWRQRHYFVALAKQVVLISGQAPQSRSAEMVSACATMARALSPL